MGERIWWTHISLIFIGTFYWSGLVSCGPGTTLNIKNIFLGRCYQYQEIASSRIWKPRTKDCGLLWDTFKSAFAYKDPKLITRADYKPFFDLAKDTTLPANKSVLWSGTYTVAHRYASDGSRFVTMEDSLVGYLTNGLTWCGTDRTGSDGINYTECPNWTDLPKAASQAYWGGASSTFAGSARGNIQLVLTGSNPDRAAYLRSSFFANFELPSIKTDQAHVTVILVNDLGKPAIERCNNGSLILLQEDMADRGLRFVCQENPPDILHLLCVDKPDAEECRFQPKNAMPLLNRLTKVLAG